MLTDMNPDDFSPIIQAIVYDSALSCLIIDRDGNLAFVNPRLARIIGHVAGSPGAAGRWLSIPAGVPSGASAGIPSGASAGVSVGVQAGSPLQPVLDQVLNGRTWSGELLLMDGQGKPSRQQAMLTPVFDSQGQPYGALGILKPLAGERGGYRVFETGSAVSASGTAAADDLLQTDAAAAADADAGRRLTATLGQDGTLLDLRQGLRLAGNDVFRYEKRLLRFSASFENAAEDLQGLLAHDDRIQIRCYLEALQSAATAIGAGQAARLASEIGQMAATPANLVPTPILALFESVMLVLQEQILDALDQRLAADMPPELDRRLDAASLDHLMEDLMAFLRSYDLNALDTFNQLADVAGGVPCYNGIELARPYIETFAFEKALRIVESVWQRAHAGPTAPKPRLSSGFVPADAANGKESSGGSTGDGIPIDGTAMAGPVSRLSRRLPRRRSAMPRDNTQAGLTCDERPANMMDDLSAMIDGRA